MKIVTTPRELMDLGLWDRACEVSGLNQWAVNEGLMDSGDSITLDAEQARRIGLQPAEQAAQEQPCRIDPPGCGCTDCLTHWSVPLDEASADDVFAMLAGQIQDATSEEFQTVTTIRARRSGREWTRETE